MEYEAKKQREIIDWMRKIKNEDTELHNEYIQILEKKFCKTNQY